ncbi:ABC transporter substrate-binding protein [Rhizohabitans arisaemae]|uniref:ABC transporter substrate-binding protein n=1 Tax=Rhizohabitans arisaemae TaxID=2720610 RepID=UPI0024B25B14|nr:PhnD/SsuA/transferrin family substrate-binding protein [Rhizohabitans arisaemae]
MTAPASVEELKAKVEGKELSIASAAFPNPTLTGMYKTLELLQSDFGVKVNFRLMDSSPMNAALISGQVQIGHVSLGGMAAAVEAGADLIAVAGNDQKNAFLVAARAPAKTLADLKGKPFAVSQNLSSIVGQTAQKCFAAAGLDVKTDTQLLHLGNIGQIVESMESGKLSGGMSATFRQIELDLKKPGTYTTVCKGWEANPQLNDVWAVSRAWLAENRDIAMALAISEIKADRWTHESKAEWVALAQAKIEGLTPEAAEANYANLVTELDSWPVNGSLDQKMCDYTLATSLEFGVLKKRFACTDLVTFDYQKAAVQFLGSK